MFCALLTSGPVLARRAAIHFPSRGALLESRADLAVEDGRRALEEPVARTHIIENKYLFLQGTGGGR